MYVYTMIIIIVIVLNTSYLVYSYLALVFIPRTGCNDHLV